MHRVREWAAAEVAPGRLVPWLAMRTLAFGTDAPAYVVVLDGVPIVSVYKRP